ncbi:MAG TPA: MarR family transcriptional regulator [Lacipirellulaceae bacterium]|jgi:predicted ArsR family transcriptional regulator|nr:MarR family transcriptional regulator [Lacipirellulaceae bacterium]
MNAQTESADRQMLDFIRRNGAVTISALIAEMGVTATAVRQRLQRLITSELVEKQAERKGRGRPNHRYSLSEKGERSAGNNFADMATVLWDEIKSIEDASIRRGLLKRIAERLAARYRGEIVGETLNDRMKSLVLLMGEREIPFAVDESMSLPVLSAHACPYPELAKVDRGVCTMEKLMLSEILGANVRLSECRLDGGSCCTFTPSAT